MQALTEKAGAGEARVNKGALRHPGSAAILAKGPGEGVGRGQERGDGDEEGSNAEALLHLRVSRRIYVGDLHSSSRTFWQVSGPPLVVPDSWPPPPQKPGAAAGIRGCQQCSKYCSGSSLLGPRPGQGTPEGAGRSWREAGAAVPTCWLRQPAPAPQPPAQAAGIPRTAGSHNSACPATRWSTSLPLDLTWWELVAKLGW